MRPSGAATQGCSVFLEAKRKIVEKNLQKQNISFTFVSVADITEDNIANPTTIKPR